MKTIAEILQEKEALKVEARALLAEGKLEEAETKTAEVRAKDKEIELTKELAQEEARALKEQEEERKVDDTKMEATQNADVFYRAMAKRLLGENLSETEARSLVKTSDNTILFPDQDLNMVLELKKGYGSLKKYCNVIPVNKNQGKMPVIDMTQNELLEVKEGDNITEGSLLFTKKDFTCFKQGLLQHLTSETIDDAIVEIQTYIRRNFAEIQVYKENARILKVLKDNMGTPIAGTSYEDVEIEMDKAIPSIRQGLITFTNQTTFSKLNNMKDKQGRNLDLITTVGDAFYFHGKELVVVDDALLAPKTAGKNIVIICNAREAIEFYDRKSFDIAMSNEAGFKDDTKWFRALERNGIVLGHKRSIVAVEF